MTKKKDTPEVEKIKTELEMLQRKTMILDSKPAKRKTKPAKKTTTKPKKQTLEPAKTTKLAKKTTTKTRKTVTKTKKTTTKPKKTTPKPDKQEEKTLEEELEEQLSDEEIENFQIEKVDMVRLTNKVCDILAAKESAGMLQSELWKKLKLTNRNGSRLALKLERMGTINREKLLEKGRWTYKLILKKTPISTHSIEDAPCLVCPVEQKCSLEGEISPRNCQLIEDWVITELKSPTKRQ